MAARNMGPATGKDCPVCAQNPGGITPKTSQKMPLGVPRPVIGLKPKGQINTRPGPFSGPF